MPRLPLIGSDDGTWGDVLNDYLVQAHNADGTLKANTVSNTTIVDGTIQAAKLAQTYIQSSEKAAANGVATLDATTKVPIGQLPAMGGDLSGTVSNAQIGAGTVGTPELAANVAQSLVPAGAITPFAGSGAPTGWFTCDGSAVSRATYGTLFTAIGTAYGAGDGSTTFNLPNLRGRVPVGLDAAQTEFDTRGEAGGAKTHTLILGEMPSHTHVQNSHNHTQDAHNHTQNSHNHTQNSHNHTQNSHNHGGGTLGAISNANQLGEQSVREAYYTGTYGLVPDGPGYQGRPIVYNNTAEPNHAHGISAEAATNIAATATNIAATATNIAATATNQVATATNQNTGGGGAHNNLQPYITMDYIIKF